MPALTITDVGQILSQLNAEYQPPGGGCVATPKKLEVLIDRLQDYTDEVQWARNKYRALGVASIAAGPLGVGVGELLGGGDVDVAQWRQDMASWQFRLAGYKEALSDVPFSQRNTPEGCALVYESVTAPLLDGIFYTLAPGVVLNEEERARILGGIGHSTTDVTGDHPPGHSNPKPPDLISPFTLGNQIVIYQDYQKENLQKLVEEVIENARKVVSPGEWPWWVKGALIAGAGVSVGLVGLYAYQFVPKSRSSNPRPARPKKIGPKKVKSMLDAAAPYREYGDQYDRGIDASAQWLEDASIRGRESQVITSYLELDARMKAKENR